MDRKRHERITKLFVRAGELDPEERTRFLDEACGDDAELRAEVESLLAHDLRAREVLGTSPTEMREATRLDGTEPEGAAEPRPDRIGPYRILRVLGSGGMGIVYLAEQEEPIRRRVALKLIRAGLDSAQVIARFESERQALALMSHNNVAKVFDAGTTEQGRPYFVMEYVDGVPVTRYCDQHRLSTSERLGIFLQICDGVQHAHQKGIIHRDLKPTNVLVAVEEGKPVPKIIDFGLAKATEQRLTEQTLATQAGALVGTPAYMSPEQANLDSVDIDTRTDVYSLGVLLYELLVGALPFEIEELRRAGLGEMLRRIREEEPSKPSTRLQSLGEASAEPARRRHADPSSLARELRGDLDWIAMKALEKARARRYGSPSELAEDIRRHLRHEPVVAGPPGAVYKIGKFVRRHRVGVTAAAAVAAALVLGIVGTTVGIVRSVRAEKLAKGEAVRANQEAATATQVSEFLVDLFDQSDPDQARGETITAREVLDTAAARIESELADQPEVRARLMSVLGRVYMRLGLLETSARYLEEALRVQLDILGEEHVDAAYSLVNLGRLNDYTGDEARARELLERGLAVREELLGPDHVDVAEPLWMLADVGAENHLELRRRALEIVESNLGRNHRKTLGIRNDVGVSLSALGRRKESIDLIKENIEIAEANGLEDDPLITFSLGNLANDLRGGGDLTGALELLERVHAITTRVYGDSHPYVTAETLKGLGNMYLRTGDLEKALPLLERALEIAEANSRPGVVFSLGAALAASGEYDKACRLIEDEIAALELRHGPDNRYQFFLRRRLGELALSSGDSERGVSLLHEMASNVRKGMGENDKRRYNELYRIANILGAYRHPEVAEDLYREALEGQRRLLGEDNPITLNCMHALGLVLRNRRKFDESAAMFRETFDMRKRVLGADDLSTLWAEYNLAATYTNKEIGKYDDAELLLRDAMEIALETLDDGHHFTISAMATLGDLYMRRGRYDDAAAVFGQIVEIQNRTAGPTHRVTLMLANDAALAVLRGGRHDEAEKILLEVLEGLRPEFGEEHWKTLKVMGNLGNVYRLQGRYDEAHPLLEKVLATQLEILRENHPALGHSHYHLGCLAAVRDDRETAVDHFRKAVDLGWGNRAILEDPDLDSLREDAEFETIVSEVMERIGKT